MGCYDELAFYTGKKDQKFPMIVNPGQTISFHPLTVSAIEENAKNSSDYQWLYFALVDSFGKCYNTSIKDVKWHLGLDKIRAPSTYKHKFKFFFLYRKLFRKHKRNLYDRS
jgi:hypothetical protein